MVSLQYLVLDPAQRLPPTRDQFNLSAPPQRLPSARATHFHPINRGSENASLYFIGIATTIVEWAGIRIMTDPNFLHAGDHVHLGPGVTATRRTNPSVDLNSLPPLDLVLLSHLHADHFDEKVEASLRRDLPIVTTPQAKSRLVNKEVANEAFTSVYELDTFASMTVDIKEGNSRVTALRITAMPGKHMAPGVLGILNHFVAAVPPTNGWILKFGTKYPGSGSELSFRCGYRIYISGDTIMTEELKEIPKRYAGRNIDLMLVHLGRTTVPSAQTPLSMVTMDETQELQLVRLIDPDVTIPIHYDDYDSSLSSLDDFKREMKEAGLDEKVIYLDRGDEFKFRVKDG